MLLFELGESLRKYENIDDLAEAITKRTAEYLHASRCLLSEIDLTHNASVTRRGYSPNFPLTPGSYPLSNWNPSTIRDMTQGKSVIIFNAETDPRTASTFETAHRPNGLVALVSIPLMQEGRWVGAFTVSDHKPRVWTPREITLIQVIAERAWLWYKHIDLIDKLRVLNIDLQQRVEERTRELSLTTEKERSLFNAIPDLIFELSREGVYLSYKGDLTNLHITPDFFIGKNISDVLPKDAGLLGQTMLQRVLATRSLQQEEYSYSSNGHERHYEIRMVPVGKDRALALVRDITESTIQKNQLREINTLFKLSPDMLCTAGPDGHFLRMNPSFKILGYTEEELRAQPFIAFVHPDDVKKTLEQTNKLRQGFPTSYFENRYRCKDGSYRWLAWTSISDEHGTLYAIARDMTQRKFEEERYRNIIENVPAAIWDEDLTSITHTLDRLKNDGVTDIRTYLIARPDLLDSLLHQMKIIDVNTPSLKMFQAETKDQFIAFIHDIFLQQTRALFIEKCVCLVNHQSQYSSTLATKTLQGTPLKLMAFIAFINEGAKTRGIITMMDITARELLRSNQELQRFAHVASHELRAPLRAIDHLTTWLEEDLNEILTPKTREKMKILRQRVDRMNHLITDLLEYASISNDVQHTEEIVDVNRLISEAINLSNIPQGFVVETQCNIPPIKTAQLPLKRAFMNLISNAIKHHDKKKGHIVISAQNKGKEIEFCISDDGPGIPAKFHTKVFEMFQMIKPRDKTEGSGIGLALVKSMVNDMGGSIMVESHGRGTTFRFTLPNHVEHPTELILH